MAKVVWEEVDQKGAVYGNEALCRAKVPGGWLVRLFRRHGSEMGVIFVPDQNHGWQDSLSSGTDPG
jgi:hypothetical protein